MNISAAHWHLLLNHFPVVLSSIAALFLISSFIVKKQFLQFASMWMMILAALFSFIAFQTGQNAEEQVEEIIGISHDAIHRHGDIANIAFRISVVSGLIALVTLILLSRKSKTAGLFVIFVLVASLVSVAYLGYTGYTGAEIRHSEIRGEFGRE